MKKIVFDTTGSAVLLVLLGLLATAAAPGEAFFISPIAVTVILVVYAVIFYTTSAIWNKKLGLPLGHMLGGIAPAKNTNSRESPFCLKAAKEGFLTSTWAMLSAMSFFFVFGINNKNGDFNMFVIGFWLIILCLVVTLVSYTRAWCREYELAEKTTSPSR